MLQPEIVEEKSVKLVYLLADVYWKKQPNCDAFLPPKSDKLFAENGLLSSRLDTAFAKWWEVVL